MTWTRLFTDADNTLWDTDSVFAKAQVGLLRDVETEVRRTVPETDDQGLAFVRRIDQRIASTHRDHLRYSPVLLASALARALAGEDPDRAADAASEAGAIPGAHAEAVGRYEQRLQAVPRLRDGVREGLAALRQSGVPVTVLTEASLVRCGGLLKVHNLSSFVSGVLSIRKDENAYRAIRNGAEEERLVMVGDQLDRDIDAAKRSGFITIFFPGGFVPSWISANTGSADHEIWSYDQIPALLGP